MKDIKFDKYVLFEIGREIYAINILYIDRIVDEQYIRKVPNTRDYIKGIINVKGKDTASHSKKGIKDIAPVVDLRLKFNIESDKLDEEPYIIIARIDDVIVGLIVDSVLDVIDIKEEELSGNMEDSISMGATDYIQAFYRHHNEQSEDDELYIIINMDKLLETETVTELKNISQP